MVLHCQMATVDLNRGRVERCPIPASWRRLFVGGRALAAYLFCRHTPGRCDATDSDNAALISAGLLSGTLSAPLGAIVVTVRSPETGALTWKCFDDPLAAEMRHAGCDLLLVKGRAKRPVCLMVADGQVTVADGRRVAGQPDAALRQHLTAVAGDGETRVLSTRERGEGERIGAALAAKNIVAVACRGTGDIQVKDPEGIIAYERRHNAMSPCVNRSAEGGTFSGAAGRVPIQELATAAGQCLGLAGDGSSFASMAERLRLNTGMAMGVGELKTVAYRSIVLERLFDIRYAAADKIGDRIASYRKDGWTRAALMKKAKVFDRLGIGDLWPRFR